METKELKIDFGGGEMPRKKEEGFKTCDILSCADFPTVDFEKDILPFKNDSISEGYSSHCLEHVGNTRHFLNELHRVIKKGCFIHFIVPYGLHPGSSKPVHKNLITECWFDFLRNTNTERIYGYKRWDFVSGSLLFHRDKNDKVYELEIKLTPIK